VSYFGQLTIFGLATEDLRNLHVDALTKTVILIPLFIANYFAAAD